MRIDVHNFVPKKSQKKTLKKFEKLIYGDKEYYTKKMQEFSAK